jgi:hypothetical protein
METEVNIVSNAINMSLLERPRLILHRSLHVFEEQEAYESLINQPNNTIILFDERSNHKYYFGKLNGQIYHVITNSNMTTIYCVRLLDCYL